MKRLGRGFGNFAASGVVFLDIFLKNDKSAGGPTEFWVWHFDDIAILDGFIFGDGGPDYFVVNFGRNGINEKGGATNQGNEASFGDGGKVAGVDKIAATDFENFFGGEFGPVEVAF